MLAAYLDGGPVPPRWPERRRVVHLIEALNTLPNAGARGWDDEFADRARRHLVRLLAEPSDLGVPGGGAPPMLFDIEYQRA